MQAVVHSVPRPKPSVRSSDMTRLSKLALATLGAALALVALGGFTRGSGSGYGCADRWPLCEGGAAGGLLPRAEFHMVVEWTHRWLAALVGVLALATAFVAWRTQRRRAAVTWPATAAVVAIGVQAYLGRQVVKGSLDRDLVAFHLTIAMVIVALLTTVVVYASRPPDPSSTRDADPRWRWFLAGGALLTYLVLLLGSMVHNVYVGGWPLVGNRVVPELSTRLVTLHYFHRAAAGLAFVYVVWLAFAARRRRRPVIEVRLVDVAVTCYLLNVVLGALHVVTEVTSSGLVVAHLATASVALTALVGATLLAHRHDREADQPRGSELIPSAASRAG